MQAHPHEIIPPPDREYRLAALLLGIAALIFAVTVLLYVLWLMLSSVQATGFDADGVRCYARAVQVACLKTANP
jgi:hypothetical protein